MTPHLWLTADIINLLNALAVVKSQYHEQTEYQRGFAAALLAVAVAVGGKPTIEERRRSDER